MIFLYSIFLFVFSWITIYRYRRYKKLGLLKEENIKKYNNRLKVRLILTFFLILFINTYQYFDMISDLVDGFKGEYFNLPEKLTGFWEIFIDIGFGGYLVLDIPGKIIQFFVRMVFAITSAFIFHTKYLLNHFVRPPKNLIKLLYLFSVLNGIYMMTEFIDLFRLGSDFLWIIRNVFGF